MPPAPLEAIAGDPPVGDIPIIGDPVRDLTVWYSDRVRDANRAALDNLRGQLLTPIDPLADTVTRTLYGPMVLITIPLLTFGGLILGYLIMVSRTSGESAYAARSVAPRFVVAATLAILGIFLVSVIAEFVAALDAAMVGVALPTAAVGGPAGWPSSGGVFTVLQQGGFDPRVAQGPDNWNSGSWLSSGLLAGVLTTCLAMLNWLLGGVERLLVLAGPLCLAAYAIPATERVTRLWFKVLVVVLAMRFAWAITFVLFSLQAAAYVGASGAPRDGLRHERPARARRGCRRDDARPAPGADPHRARGAADPRRPGCRAARGCAAVRLAMPNLVDVPENAVREEPLAFGLAAPQLLVCGIAVGDRGRHRAPAAVAAAADRR